MNNIKTIIDKYPKIFEQNNNKLYNSNWSCPNGWLHILDWLCGSIQNYLDMVNNNVNNRNVPQVKCIQVKEKFAGLRFYYDGGDDHINGMVRMAEYLATLHCQNCGTTNNVQTINTGWLYNVCDNCKKT